jgi:two-component system chemotaxis response regulator CheB
MAKIIKKPIIELLIVGGSAGSLDVLLNVLPDLRADLNFAIIIVLHRKYNNDSSLTGLIAAKTRMKVKEVDDKDEILPGWIYLAPADYHLLIETNHTLALDYSEKVNYSRPCIDVTFQTATEAYGAALSCLLLSGASADGADGLELVRQNGGITAVQDPECAEVSYMPLKAIEKSPPNYILDIQGISDFINSLDEQSAS